MAAPVDRDIPLNRGDDRRVTRLVVADVGGDKSLARDRARMSTRGPYGPSSRARRARAAHEHDLCSAGVPEVVLDR
jgi:hypothetical protein